MATHVMANGALAQAGGRGRGRSALFSWLQGAALKITSSWSWYQDYRRTTQELQGLTDKELDDIGIARFDIPTIAMQSANATQDKRFAAGFGR